MADLTPPCRHDPDGWPDGYGDEARPRMGFFTDTTVCIGCKACEVACKEWNGVPESPAGFTGNSYDNTMGLDADTWRHVAFVERPAPDGGVRWLMSSDVCKHCTYAACLEVCPTGALFRTEFGTVVVQQDVCNGCGYCVPACPFGVIDMRRGDGRVWKCTLCYDRLKGGLEPACAQACPTDSIQFGPLDELRMYGAAEDDGVGGFGAFFLLLDEPQVYGLPPRPVDQGRELAAMWRTAAAAAGALVVGVAAACLGARR
jgi:formate dehydrogenase iron-sulfur subunit